MSFVFLYFLMCHLLYYLFYKSCLLYIYSDIIKTEKQKDRKKKTEENTMKKITTKKSTSGRIQVSLLCIMCIAILIVSFMALVKMENNIHGMMVFAWGSLMNLIIFSSGMSHIRNTIRCV